jgi:putative peptidoglycan lipid II flippase
VTWTAAEEDPQLVAPAAGRSPDSGGGGGLLGAAAVLAAGNVASRLLGLARETAVAALYGSEGVTSAIRVAASVPTLLNDLLITGQLSAAVVPVLTAYRTERREAFWEAASVLLSVAAVVTTLAGAAVYVLAGPLAALLAPGLGAEGMRLVAESLEVLAPSVLFLGLVGMTTGVLFARGRFGWPAAAMTSFNAAFLVALLLGYVPLGPLAMPLALTLSALTQLLVLLPGLAGGRLRPSLNLRHPALRRVIWLYLPILAGLLVEQAKNVVDIRLATGAGEASYSHMQFATRLVQFPHGLVAVAISLAILPLLSASVARGAEEEYASVLARGLRLVATLALPAALGLAVLAQPAVASVYEYRAFGAEDRVAVALTLVVYLIGLPFAALDWPLNYAFYARQNTWVPALVGVVAALAFLAVAVLFGPVLNLAGLGPAAVFLGLVLADSVKHIIHAGIMAVLLRRAVGPAALAGLRRTLLAAGLAALGMAAGVALLDALLARWLPAGALAWLTRLALGSLLGIALYVPFASRLGVAELPWMIGILRARLAAARA